MTRTYTDARGEMANANLAAIVKEFKARVKSDTLDIKALAKKHNVYSSPMIQYLREKGLTNSSGRPTGVAEYAPIEVRSKACPHIVSYGPDKALMERIHAAMERVYETP